MLKIAIITNKLASHRVPVYSKIAHAKDVQLNVFACAERDPNRNPDLPRLDAGCTILCDHLITLHGRYIHNNLDIIAALKQFYPDVVVTDGFDPIHLYAFAYASTMGWAHVVMTDSTDISEQTLGITHRAIRQLVYSKSNAFISASLGGARLFGKYCVPAQRCFISALCVNNAAFSEGSQTEKKEFDFIFCGEMELIKNPAFALEVAVQVAKRLRRKVSILFVGRGSEEANVQRAAALYPGLMEAKFIGVAAQHELPALYQSAKLFLFPALWDPWGMATNEACAAGLPVIVSPSAGAANELVRNDDNGFVCDLDSDLWADQAEYLLTQPWIYKKFSQRSRELVSQYTSENAATGIVDACRFAVTSGATDILPVKSKPRVVIVERQLLHYRMAFYNRLRALLDKEGIELQLLVGHGTPDEEKKMDQVTLDWAIHIPTQYLLGTTLCWQPFGKYAKEADLVIVMHENKIIYNLWLLSFGRPKRLAFWGHGRNMQSDHPNGLKERFKRWTVNKVDWWFAYTETSAALVASAGFPRECTTIVENAVDTEEMTALCALVSAAECQRKREELRLGDGPVALYLGSLYKEKRLDFLLDAAHKIHEKIDGFQLLIVGAGPEQEQIESAAKQYPWIHYLGPLQDRKKAVALVLADVILNPGLVGLGILDSFTSGTPMFTTDCGLHSPEISYLSSGKNGVMTNNDVTTYANTVIDVLSEPQAIAKLSKGALSSATRYTVENMADRIRMGICACLSSP